MTDNEPEDLVTITAFGHSFTLFPELAQDLITLEKEGAIYAESWDESAQQFRYYRIPFLPSETVRYVEGHVAMQEFENAVVAGASFEEALSRLADQRIAQQVYAYDDFGKSKLRDGTVIDLRGNPASFYGPELEALVCGLRPDRYELLPDLNHANTTALLKGTLDAFPVLVSHLATRKRNRPSFDVATEYDMQDLLFVCVRAVFRDARVEEWAPQHAGTAKRIDIVVPSVQVVLETKFVRNRAHAARVADEIKIDIESYHAHPSCHELLVLVWDPHKFLGDPQKLTDDLSGLRVKGNKSFTVAVVART
jgi:hypothetical protein